MFSQNFSSLKIRELLEDKAPTTSEVQSILDSSEISLVGTAKLLLALDDDSARNLIFEKATQVRRKKWGNQLFLMPPLYISDGDPEKGGCLDHCRYCLWRHGNVPKAKLKRLSVSETATEARILLGMGYQDIEIVSATDPILLDAKKASEYIRSVKKVGTNNIGINFFPLKTSDDYQQLAEAGCTFSIVWQETYFPKTYRIMHPKGPKSNMTYRLDAQDRALQGGIKNVGLAFLGGLTDWKYEALSTIAHAIYLRSKYNAHIIFGMPRLKGNLVASVNYSDEAYRFVGAIYSLVMPDALPWFSTREVFELSTEAAKGGGCIFTLDCSTEVGGYTRKNGFAQFPVYSRSFAEGFEWLGKLGFNVQTTLPW